MKPKPGHFIDQHWREMPLFSWPVGEMRSCSDHGEYDPHAYFSDNEISEMIATDDWHCPLCLEEICGAEF